MPSFPLTLQTPRSVFRFDHEQPGPDGERLIVGSIQSFAGGWAQFACSMPDLLAFADLIYRAAGKQPRDVEQLVRVELVAPPAPSAPPPVDLFPLAAGPDDQDGKEAIKRRMIAGR